VQLRSVCFIDFYASKMVVVVVIAGKIPSIVYCFDNAFGCTLLFVLVSRVLRAIVGVIDKVSCRRNNC